MRVINWIILIHVWFGCISPSLGFKLPGRMGRLAVSFAGVRHSQERPARREVSLKVNAMSVDTLFKNFKKFIRVTGTPRPVSTESSALVQRQLALETKQWDNAVDDYLKLKAKLVSMGLSNRLRHVRETLAGWMDSLVPAIEAAVRTDPEMAVIAMETVVSKILRSGNEGMKVVTLATSLGECIETEMHLQATLSEMDKTNRTVVSRARKAFGSVWNDRRKVEVGAALLSCLVNSTRAASDSDEPAFVRALLPSTNGRSPAVLTLTPSLHERLSVSGVARVTDHKLPMLVPPLEWDSATLTGGYLSLPTKLIRADSPAQTEAVRRASMAPIVEGLNYLGHVAWRINEPVMRVMEQIYAEDLQIGGIPSRHGVPNPDPAQCRRRVRAVGAVGPSGPLSPAQEQASFDKALYDELVAITARKNRNIASSRSAFRHTLEVARRLHNETLYFPHSLDFRGRAYPVPSHLNHLGNDVHRGLLLFAEARPLGEEGWRWLRIHLCNLFGNNKISLEDRLKWADEHLADILDSAAQPLGGKRWWASAEKPFQALATCMDIRAALLARGGPAAHLSRLSVHQDGSCNGLQHYAALSRDEEGGAAVNLRPAPAPQDVYSEVLALVRERVTLDAAISAEVRSDATRMKGKLARLVLGLLDRSVVKLSVMTSVYGVTRAGIREQLRVKLRERLEKQRPETVMTAAMERMMTDAAEYLTDVVLGSLELKFRRATALMDWLRECARLVAAQNEPVSWVTPLGLPVIQHYRRRGESESLKTPLQWISLSVANESAPVDGYKQRLSFPPNFVHSLDSTHMFMTALRMKDEGRVFAAVHDSYWTHAGDVPRLNELLRDTFTELYASPVLEDLLQSLRARHPTVTFPDIPSRGSLDVGEVKGSLYFFH